MGVPVGGVGGLKSVGDARGSQRGVKFDGHSDDDVCEDGDGESLMHAEDYVGRGNDDKPENVEDAI